MISIDPISISVLGLIAYQLQSLNKKIKDTNKRVDRIHNKVKEIEVTTNATIGTVEVEAA